jgi:hypothetical protein
MALFSFVDDLTDLDEELKQFFHASVATVQFF